MKINIVAIDPGDATGVAALTGDDDFITHSSIIIPGESLVPWLRGVFKFHNDLGDRLHLPMERFITGSRTRGHTVQDAAMMLFGVVEQMAKEDEHVVFYAQQAADAKRIADNDRLRKLEMFHSGEGHDNDATRHAILCLARLFPQAYIKLLMRHGIISPEEVK